MNPSSERFLQKLFALAGANNKIREVILLMLLEPVRRLQVKASTSDKNSTIREYCRRWNDFQTQHSEIQSRQKCLTLDRELQKESKMDLFPLLTSSLFILPSKTTSSHYNSSFRCHVTQEDMEKEFTRPEIVALVRLVIETEETSEQLEHSSVSQTRSQPMSWWSLPSPLLCTISQMHFSLAREYIRNWIGRALEGYNEAYGDLAGPGDTFSGDDFYKKNNNALFQQSVRRIRQFCSTSQRLSILASQMLDAAGSDCFDDTMDNDKGVRKTDYDFRKSLALKAIRRTTFPDCGSAKTF